MLARRGLTTAITTVGEAAMAMAVDTDTTGLARWAAAAAAEVEETAARKTAGAAEEEVT